MKFSQVKYCLVFCVLCLASYAAVAQDIHFSQYFASPLTVNPANTALFDGDYRIGANFRQQWKVIPVPYNTFAAYADMELLKNKNKDYFAGAGLSLQSDRAGDGNLGINKVFLSGAFHYALDKNRKNYISLGIQGGWVQKRIDWNKLYFHNQYDEMQFNKSLPSGETGYKSGFGYPDLQAGIIYSYGASKNFSFFASVAAFHLIKPGESFYEQPHDSGVVKNNLGIRPVYSAGSTIKVSEKVSIYPSVYYMSQKKAGEFYGGSLVSYDFNAAEDEHNRFFLGAFMRVTDAWYPVVGYEYKNIRALFNYDINSSELKPASSGRGAWELSVVFTGSRFKAIPKIFDMPCPRF